MKEENAIVLKEIGMKANPDIIKDFSRLQADVAALSKSNVEFAQENARMRERIKELEIELEVWQEP